VLLFERFIIIFGFIELPFKVRNVFLVTFLSAVLNARDLQLYSIANISFLQERHLVITQFLEWSAGCVKLRRQRLGERTRGII